MIRHLLFWPALALVTTLASAAEQGAAAALRVYGDVHAPEMAPVSLAARDMGQAAVSVSDGGIDSLFDGGVASAGAGGVADVAAGTEIQTLRSSVTHPNLRVIFTIAEGYCRIVARKSAGIAKLADLRGKKIGTVAESPSEYFLQKMLAGAGLGERDVTVVVPPGSVAGAGAALRSGEVDALSVSESTAQSAVELLGSDAIEFQDRGAYRELFNLNTTAQQLADPVKRSQIVAFVAGLIRASGRIRAAAPAGGQQAYFGTLAHDLPDVMAVEDGWLTAAAAGSAGSTQLPGSPGSRVARSRAELVTLVDPTVRLDALALAHGDSVAGTLATARERIERLDVGVDNSEAIRAVKVLQYAYAQYLEQGRWKDAADLFTDSARPGVGTEGLATGKLNLRMVLSPVINLSADGMHAKGRWHEVALLGDFGRSATWEGGIYENDYVREQGIWKIAGLHFYPQYAGTYEAGWRSGAEASAVVPYHYDSRSAGVPIPDEARNATRGGRSPASVPEELPALAVRLATLEQRVQRLNDASEVQNLQHAYGYYVDRMLWDDVVDLFVPEGSMEINGHGVYVGKVSIHRALEQSGGGGLHRSQLNDQLQLETVVSVSPDGRSAHARGIQLGLTSAAGAGQWSESLYDGEYVKQGGIWMLRNLRIYPRMAADYSVGWAKSAVAPATAPGKDLPPPDRPSRKRYGMYPAAQFPPMPYAHPVRPAVRPVGSPRDAPTASGPGPGAGSASTLAELLGRIASVERKLAMSEAYDGAENVSNAYGYYIDEFKWNDTADLFATDGWKELSYIGTYVGRERVRQSMVLRYGSNGRTGRLMTLHQKTQPVVHVSPDGMSARIRTRLFQFNSSTDTPGSYIGGIYENEVVNEDGVWRISGMDLDYVWSTSYTSGWARATAEDARRFAPPPGAPPPPLAPDRPLRGVVYAPFPEIVDVPFHYRNPVSGRPPAVLLLP